MSGVYREHEPIFCVKCAENSMRSLRAFVLFETPPRHDFISKFYTCWHVSPFMNQIQAHSLSSQLTTYCNILKWISADFTAICFFVLCFFCNSVKFFCEYLVWHFEISNFYGTFTECELAASFIYTCHI